LAVTRQRLLILKMNAMGTKADEIVSEVPIAEVESIRRQANRCCAGKSR